MPHLLKTGRFLTAALALFYGVAGQALAQETAPAPAQTSSNTQPSTENGLRLELNSLDASDKGCRLTFVATNNFAQPLDKVTFEMVLFNAEKRVERLALLDFKGLPGGKTKVRRFDLSNITCDHISRILINDATECSGEGILADACVKQLHTSSNVEVKFGL